jgi:hypothetical protein
LPHRTYRGFLVTRYIRNGRVPDPRQPHSATNPAPSGLSDRKARVSSSDESRSLQSQRLNQVPPRSPAPPSLRDVRGVVVHKRSTLSEAKMICWPSILASASETPSFGIAVMIRTGPGGGIGRRNTVARGEPALPELSLTSRMVPAGAARSNDMAVPSENSIPNRIGAISSDHRSAMS